MTWPRGVREAGLAFAVALTAMVVCERAHLPLLRALETASLDLRFRLRGVRLPGPESVVILVDDKSLAALGRWPLSRSLFARALATLDRDEARLVVFDLLFAEPESPVSPELRAAARAAATALPAGDERVRAAVARLAEDDPDDTFAAAIRNSGNVLLPIAFAFGKASHEPPADLSGAAYQRFANSPVPPEFPLQPDAALLPVPVLEKAAAGLGHVEIAYDRDGQPRYDYLALPFNGDFLPSIAVRAAARWLGVKWAEVGLALGQGVEIGPISIATDRAMRLVVNYRGPRGTFPTYSFVDLVAGRVPAAALKGRLVLIGASFIGISDANASPFGNTPLPGTERLASIIDSILHRDFVAESPPPWPWLVLAAVLLLAMATGGAVALLPTRLAALAGAVPIVLWCGAAQLAFVRGLWLPLVEPLIALGAATATAFLFRYGVVDRDGRRVRTAFRRYLAPEMVNLLAAHPERLSLGGETRTMSFMFSDIRGFTAISERFKARPQELTRLINRFLTPMTELIMARGGTIDKYMGDCIMAFWNAPLDDALHADHACASALAMLDALDAVNAQLAAEAAAEGRPPLPLLIGIGINTGQCVVGNMGSDQRFDYTVLGDAVNLAARFETQTKAYHVDILIGEATRQAAPQWAALELDLIAVVGKEEAVRIYALLGDAALAQSMDFKALQEIHEEMLRSYRVQHWDRARELIARCRPHEPRLAGLYDLYEARLAQYAADPPGPDWDGVFVALTK